jgi:hypothetical protein|tara:strand:+ start:372 stop:662 length:291 start_codon:yes stop_codon:yes gene_type:complete
MNSEENRIEQESLDFLTTCSVDDFVALYEHMTLCKLEEVQDDTLDLKYEIVESEADPVEAGTIVSFDKMVEGVEAIFGMTTDDVKILHEKICQIRS